MDSIEKHWDDWSASIVTYAQVPIHATPEMMTTTMIMMMMMMVVTLMMTMMTLMSVLKIHDGDIFGYYRRLMKKVTMRDVENEIY